MPCDVITKKRHFKIRRGNKKVGIVAETFIELVEKCSSKFNMGKDCIILSLEDETEVDEEYFDVLEKNEILQIKAETSLTSPLINRLEEFLFNYKKNNFENFDEKLKDVLKIENVREMLYSLSLLEDASTSQSSSRAEDVKWFEGLDTKYKTKEDVLKNSAENRMRGYFQKLKKDLEHCKTFPAFQQLTNEIRDNLKNKRYHSYYFDRSESDSNLRLCDSQGLFKCYGDFQTPNCPTLHQINPYKSREERIIFSTWNFDHIIEKSRSIIPAVREALEESPGELTVNQDYLFELLFKHRRNSNGISSGNLKLVHIVCHNKNPHKLVCDKKSLIIGYSPEKSRAKRMKYT